MMLKRCKACNIYTLKEQCPSCGRPTSNPRPARFSPEDPYGAYRRKLKLEVQR
ncbi:MAG: RNA-protein complex protein Nop10 [Euryarchaeota archaeon]|nr:RNA-protein complex protein Nop10 [Euryarchaeota archaeon]